MPRDDLTPPPKRNALLAPTELTLADVLARLEADQAIDPVRRRDLVSAVRRFCALVGREPAMLSARTTDLRPALESISAATANIATKTLANTRSGLLAALRVHGAVLPANRRRQHLQPVWKALMAKLASGMRADGLSRFVRFCSASGIQPGEVDDTTVTRFMEAVYEGTFARKPKDIHRGTCRLWNDAIDTVPGWPSQRLSVPSYRKPRWTTPLSGFPVGFQRDVEAYLAWLQDPLADPPPRHTCRPQTIISIRLSLTQAASALVVRGKAINSFANLADLTDPEAVRTICRHYLERFDNKPTATIRQIMTYLVQIAERWVNVDQADLTKLKALRSKLGHPPTGLTEKNRSTMRQFDDPAALDRLLKLPRLLLDDALAGNQGARRATVTAQLALVIEILLNAPMRSRNLIGLRLDRHVIRSGDSVTIVLPAEEMKTAEPMEFPLPREAIDILDTYCKRFRPLVACAGNPFLFPSLESDCKRQSTLAQQIQRTVYKRAGLRMSNHQFRHLSAKLYLTAHPGGYVVVQQLLGHRNIKTTLNKYAGRNTAQAQAGPLHPEALPSTAMAAGLPTSRIPMRRR